MKAQEKALLRRLKPSVRESRNLRLVGTDESDRTRHGSKPSKRRSLVRPDLSCQVEPFSKIASELPPLFERHYNELWDGKGSAPLEPDWNHYFALEATGHLLIMTARCGDTLAGYIISVIGPALLSRKALQANIEKFYLDPAYRGGGFANRWLKANDAMLKELGVKFVSVAVKNNYAAGRVGNLFKRLGYNPIETVWMRCLQD